MAKTSLESIEPGMLDDLKHRVVEVARGLFENKLVVSTFGVVSIRIPNTAIVLEDAATIALHSIMLAKPREFTRRELKYLKDFKATRYGQKPGTT